jgi:hypothetical protein
MGAYATARVGALLMNLRVISTKILKLVGL